MYKDFGGIEQTVHLILCTEPISRFETFNHAASNGEPYVERLPGRPELFLVIPISEWDETRAIHVIGDAPEFSESSTM